jgi:hypothetical protein
MRTVNADYIGSADNADVNSDADADATKTTPKTGASNAAAHADAAVADNYSADSCENAHANMRMPDVTNPAGAATGADNDTDDDDSEPSGSGDSRKPDQSSTQEVNSRVHLPHGSLQCPQQLWPGQMELLCSNSLKTQAVARV